MKDSGKGYEVKIVFIIGGDVLVGVSRFENLRTAVTDGEFLLTESSNSKLLVAGLIGSSSRTFKEAIQLTDDPSVIKTRTITTRSIDVAISFLGNAISDAISELAPDDALAILEGVKQKLRRLDTEMNLTAVASKSPRNQG